jgi:hypothetical protein
MAGRFTNIITGCRSQRFYLLLLVQSSARAQWALIQFSNVYRNSFAKLCDCFAAFAVKNTPKTAKIAKNAQSFAKKKLH